MQPLAERLRPKTLDEYIGKKHLVGEHAVLRQMIESGRIASFILWGPPGVGKTTLARIIANKSWTALSTPLSAVTSGVKDVREVIDKAKQARFFNQGANPILFIDEIHRFSKSQQDSLLGAVENGTVTLIGATTENPSFEVITPLLSRCQVYVLKPLEREDLLELAERAIKTDVELAKRHIVLDETEALLRFAGGDARKLLNILELVASADEGDTVHITNEVVTERLQQNPWPTTRTARCTTTSSRPSSSRCVAATRTRPSTGWLAWWRAARTRSSSPGGSSSWRRRTSGWPIPMPCCWPTPASTPCRR